MCPLIPVVPGGAAPLPVDAHHPGGHQAGPARGQGHHREAQGQEAGAYYLPTGENKAVQYGKKMCSERWRWMRSKGILSSSIICRSASVAKYRDAGVIYIE